MRAMTVWTFSAHSRSGSYPPYFTVLWSLRFGGSLQIFQATTPCCIPNVFLSVLSIVPLFPHTANCGVLLLLTVACMQTALLCMYALVM